MFSSVIESFRTDRSAQSLLSNLVAGVVVGIIALPLSMALAIAINVDPRHGLYTAIVAGMIAALAGGSRVNITGPTAAFVVILLPIVHQYGLGGLLTAGLMAGIILVALGLARMGRLVEVVPYPVIIGFTAGVGVVIATLQIKDFLGLTTSNLSGSYLDKLTQLVIALPSLSWREALIGAVTLGILIAWPRLKSRIPGHLIALLAGSLLAIGLGLLSPQSPVETIGSRFHYLVNGISGNGIPPVLPSFEWPWNLPGADGKPLGLSFDLIRSLLPAALTIAMLGALESLLCSVVADGMSGRKHQSNDELVGQGLGNIVAPLFGGIPATAAIARTAANIRAGGTSPLAAVVHSVFILLSILLLAPWLAYIPMASMAALLLMVAWNMSEAHHFVRILRIAPKNDILVLLTCFSLTVLFDMTVAVAVGIGLAAALFIQHNIELTEAHTVTERKSGEDEYIPDDTLIYDINGPLFFGSAQRALSNLPVIAPGVRVVILDMNEVNLIDVSAMIVLESIIEDLKHKGITLIISNLQPRMILKLNRLGIQYDQYQVRFAHDRDEALRMAQTAKQESPTQANT